MLGFSKLLHASVKYSKHCKNQERNLWGWLNSIFNRYDSERVKEVGADRACAEWLLRCGAHVKWKNGDSWEKDYNKLPLGSYSKYKIEEINADDAAIMGLGFEHFNGLLHVKKIRFHKCTYLQDEAVQELHRLKDTLEDLEISSCGDITDRGLSNLIDLKKLKKLLLYNLSEVHDKKGCYELLKQGLQECHVEFPDAVKDTK